MKLASYDLGLVGVLAAIIQSTTATNVPFADPAECCAALESTLPKITYSQTDQADLYQQSILSYFSVQDRLTPSCLVAPSTTEDVSRIVALLSQKHCQFAVRSGGHGLLVGSSNIEEGVTVDLSDMKSVTLSDDNTTAAVQPGAKWIDVYETLDPLGFAIPGGRAGNVGVGGLTSGGGNSFFTARYGFVCDNVKNFEVVLGTGEIVQANKVTRPDLFTALKGAQNNLGIITRFDFVAFEQGLLWGGVAFYDNTTIPAQMEAFVEFTNDLAKDPYGSLIFNWVYFPSVSDQVQLQNIYEYTGKFQNNLTTYPPAFANFSNTSAIGPPLTSTLRLANLTSLTTELNGPANVSNLFATLTFSNNLTVFQHVTEILASDLEYYKKDPFFYFVAAQFQPLPRLFTKHSLEKGGNVLGLDRYEDNNIIFLLYLVYNTTTQNATAADSAAHALGSRVLNNLTTYLQSANALKEFQYINYASSEQDPLGGYGPTALGLIRNASAKYDQGKVFQDLVPGGWKLDGVVGRGK